MLQVKIFEGREASYLETEMNKWFMSHGATITVEHIFKDRRDIHHHYAIFYKSSLPDGHPHR